MMFKLMDLLACPICKAFPLKLFVFKNVESKKDAKLPKCEEYCGYNGKPISQLKFLDCSSCLKIEIIDGILVCPSCGRWYPIEDEIPRMLPDGLREKSEELKFLRKYSGVIPHDILSQGKPFHI